LAFLLWSGSKLEGRSRVLRRARLEDGTNDVYVSVVSAWEISIKQSLGKLELAKPAEQWLTDVLRRSNFGLAEVGLAAALRVRALPWHHRDPFDRLLLAQAAEDGYTVVTRNSALDAYGIPILGA